MGIIPSKRKKNKVIGTIKRPTIEVSEEREPCKLRKLSQREHIYPLLLSLNVIISNVNDLN